QRGSRAVAAGDASTAGASETSDEEHSERAATARLGLWRCSPPIREQLFINKRLGLRQCSLTTCGNLFINERLVI
ncbi:hypothetical protein, partial [Halorubrum distributum]|uniref:hypothetical protein n=1 Tax=Halorubrum distributum TaxID=29283 RepID=UPI00193AD833